MLIEQVVVNLSSTGPVSRPNTGLGYPARPWQGGGGIRCGLAVRVCSTLDHIFRRNVVLGVTCGRCYSPTAPSEGQTQGLGTWQGHGQGGGSRRSLAKVMTMVMSVCSTPKHMLRQRIVVHVTCSRC